MTDRRTDDIHEPPAMPTVEAEGTASRLDGIAILGASFLVLFQELALIRWLPSQVRVLAYFPNVVLISAFLGLGLGSLRAGRRRIIALWPLGVLLLTAVGALLSRIAFTAEGAGDHLWLLYYDLPEGSPVVAGVRLPILVVFVLCTLSFIPLGQFLGERLERFRAAGKALQGYGWDLAGSLAGVVAFALASMARTFPIAWFAVIFAVGLALMGRRRRVLTTTVGLVTLAIVAFGERAETYSPYYSISSHAGGEFGQLVVQTNGSLHQVAVSMDLDADDTPLDQLIREGYRLPYQRLGRPPGRVLVLGAGTGNDVSTALAAGASSVDAVEIDPEILALGDQHPDRPYADPRVTVHATDARSFLNDSDERWDLIVFGTLDSMTRLSALSNVRLDNFVYTRESLAAARDHLAENGGVALYFMVGETYIHRHLLGTLIDVFDATPQVIAEHRQLFNHLYLAGPAFVTGDSSAQVAAFRRDVLPTLEIPTDDWPYLYLESRGISGFYVSLILALALLAVSGVFLASPEIRASLRRGGSAGGIDWEMLLYGAAFLMMETRFVTEMSLAWGATWATSAVVFGSILVVILVATLMTSRWRVPFPVAGGGLLLALIATYAIPTANLVTTAPALRLLLSVLYVGAPIFFAAICFALRYRTRPAAQIAFGWNVLGAVMGGLLEFSSMAIGIKALSLLAIAAYLVAFLLQIRAADRSALAGDPRRPAR